MYQCLVRGSGESTAKARWDFHENDCQQNGLGTGQTLVMTLTVAGGGVWISANECEVGAMWGWRCVVGGRDLVFRH